MQNKTTTRDVQLAQLDTLKDVRDFCEQEGIRYCLHCGTLLGCIRHGGFIPWDDDADVAMLRDDYRKFVEKFPGYRPDKYEIDSIYVDKYYNRTWTKICRKGTTFANDNEILSGKNWGISLDVYPVVGVFENRTLERIQSFLLGGAKIILNADFARKSGIRLKGSHRLYETVYILPGFVRRAVAKILMKTLFLDPDKHERVGSIDGWPLAGKFERSMFDDLITGTFEGEEFAIPRRYEEMLNIMYWDYKWIPPVEMRTGHRREGHELIMDTERDYKEYRKIYRERQKKS